MPTVRNRLPILLAEKKFNENKKISLREVASESGVSLSVITSYMNGSVTRFDGDTIAKLCTYLNCGIEDLLVIVEDARFADDPEEKISPSHYGAIAVA